MSITRNSLQPSDECIALVKRFEGLRHSVYKDIRGFYTIGYGHKFLAGDAFETIPTSKAEELLAVDMAIAARVVNHFTLVALNQLEFNALVDFVFNLGAGNFQASTLLKLLNSSNYHSAAEQLLCWDHANGVVVHDLLERRMAEFDMFMKGIAA